MSLIMNNLIKKLLLTRVSFRSFTLFNIIIILHIFRIKYNFHVVFLFPATFCAMFLAMNFCFMQTLIDVLANLEEHLTYDHAYSF